VTEITVKCRAPRITKSLLLGLALSSWDRWRGILRAANPSSGGRHWTTTTTT